MYFKYLDPSFYFLYMCHYVGVSVVIYLETERGSIRGRKKVLRKGDENS